MTQSMKKIALTLFLSFSHSRIGSEAFKCLRNDLEAKPKKIEFHLYVNEPTFFRFVATICQKSENCSKKQQKQEITFCLALKKNILMNCQEIPFKRVAKKHYGSCWTKQVCSMVQAETELKIK